PRRECSKRPSTPSHSWCARAPVGRRHADHGHRWGAWTFFAAAVSRAWGTVTFVDSAILDLTEWCCRRFQVLTGRTNVWLGVQLTNLSIVVYFVWAAMYFWRAELAARVFVGLFCAGVLYALTQTIFKDSIETYEIYAYRRVAKGLRNPRRVRDAALRFAFLTLSLLLSYPVAFVSLNLRVRLVPLTYSLIVLTTAVLYLLACDPLPPCTGKVRHWIQALASSRRADLTPETTPDR